MNHLYREVMAEIGYTESGKESLIIKLQNEYRKRTENKHRISMPRWIVASVSAVVVLVIFISIGFGIFYKTAPTPQYPDGYRAIGINEIYENSTGDSVRLTEIFLCDNISYQGTDYTDSFIVLTLDLNYREYYLNSKQVVLTYLLNDELNVTLLNAELTSLLSDVGIDSTAKDVTGTVYLVFTVSDELKDYYKTAREDMTYWGSEMKLAMNGVNDKAYSETIFRMFYSDIRYTNSFSF